ERRVRWVVDVCADARIDRRHIDECSVVLDGRTAATQLELVEYVEQDCLGEDLGMDSPARQLVRIIDRRVEPMLSIGMERIARREVVRHRVGCAWWRDVPGICGIWSRIDGTNRTVGDSARRVLYGAHAERAHPIEHAVVAVDPNTMPLVCGEI